MKDAFSTATLSDGLTNSTGLANAEKELGDHFKAAALSIATLYRASLATSKQSYNAGYLACLMDLQTFMHAGVSIQGQGEHPSSSEALTIERVMDWVDGRLEALKDDEDDSDDDKERDSGAGPNNSQRRPTTTPQSATCHPPASSSPSRTLHRPEAKSQCSERGDLPSRHERRSSPNRNQSPIISRSASSPPPSMKLPSTRKERAMSLHPPQHYPRSFITPDAVVEFPLITGADAPPDEMPFSLSAVSIAPDASISVGSKRRHSSIVDQAPSSGSRANIMSSNTQRRRGRHSRIASSQGANGSVPPSPRERTNSLLNAESGQEAMEIEERPRKSARR